VNVDHDALVGEALAGLDALQRHGNLEYGPVAVEAQVEQAVGFPVDLVGRFAQGFHLEHGHDAGQFEDEGVDVGNARGGA
jgi:hypothetical protein